METNSTAKVQLEIMIDEDLAEILHGVSKRGFAQLNDIVEFALFLFVNRVIEDVGMRGEIVNKKNLARHMVRLYKVSYADASQSFRSADIRG